VSLRSEPKTIPYHMTHSSGQNRAPSRPWAARGRLSVAALGLLVVGLAGCSMSIPLKSFMNNDTTGSIKPATSPLSADLDMKDWRIAEPVLAQALQSGEPEAAMHWSNPDSGRSGAFQPVAAAFSREGRPCRAFVARILAADGPKMLQAIGCPGEGGMVALDRVEPWKGL
jgi:17 kDa outer membrane surface antigen